MVARSASSIPTPSDERLTNTASGQVFAKSRLAASSNGGVKTIDVTSDASPESLLAACDVAATCFSSSALDHAYLSAYAQHPIGTVLYLLTNKEIQSFVTEVCGFPVFPTVEQGLGKVANDSRSVASLLASAMEKKEREDYHLASKRLSREFSMKDVIDTVASEIGITH